MLYLFGLLLFGYAGFRFGRCFEGVSRSTGLTDREILRDFLEDLGYWLLDILDLGRNAALEGWRRLRARRAKKD